MNNQLIKRKPPLNGSFPLDHHGDCKEFVKEYLACLQRSSEDQEPCLDLISKYLACRKEKGLLEEDDARAYGIE